ncbi:MAG TPA: S1 RNA-binding domain-containing protein [Gemmataceae bacterium]|nr:S1 RNA-binding domain-containing protein [Gemmataceae bacterium]
MSDTEKPTEPTPPPPEQPPAAEQPPTAKPPREKPPQRSGKVPSLQQEQSYGFGKKIDSFDEEMERQLQEAMSGMSDKDLYGEPAQQPRRGKAAPDAGPKKGKVFRIHGQDVFIDLPGGRTQGVLPLLQFPDGPPAIGTEIEITIEGFDSANGVMLLSRKGAAIEADWSSVAAGMTVEARVTETNKGGLSVDVNGIRGFMPISQIDLYRVEDAEQFVNQRLLCMVTEVDPVERNLVVSRRALLEKQREEMRDKLWNELAEGQVRQGIVRSIRDFGAFVDLGGVDGLLHVSEMNWQRVQDPSTIVQPGQTVKVVVLKIDHERRKVGLGLKQLTASPWDNIGEKYHLGDIVTGKVSRLMDFGAFVELEPAVEGLIHISELAPQRVFRVGDIVKPDQEVQVKVLSVDPAQRRISLSLKAAQVKEPEPVAEEPEPEVPVKPTRPRTAPLRGGTGSGGPLFQLPKPPSTDKGE